MKNNNLKLVSDIYPGILQTINHLYVIRSIETLDNDFRYSIMNSYDMFEYNEQLN